ncbi:hypothetical protein, partial [uncultured Muribaculum sp.]|uniref:hypothetical protein n=1 Tax=uncultured Muribaculum sp. TaxID=1918613 RepID=UPI0025AE0DE6
SALIPIKLVSILIGKRFILTLLVRIAAPLLEKTTQPSGKIFFPRWLRYGVSPKYFSHQFSCSTL